MADGQTKAQTKTQGWTVWAVLILCGFILYNCGVISIKDADEAGAEPRAKRPYAETCTVGRYGVDASLYMRTIVKRRLNDPGSARFPNALDGVRVDRATCTFTVTGEFSAKNGFGGRVRGYYNVRLQRSEDGKWSLVDADVVG